MRRKEPHIYVANWFYLAFIVTVAVLHITNNAAVPVSIFLPKSYVVWSGVQDGDGRSGEYGGRSAVGFFDSAAGLVFGIMYFFIPKRQGGSVDLLPVWVVHHRFWALIFLYIWAGPHHSITRRCRTGRRRSA